MKTQFRKLTNKEEEKTLIQIIDTLLDKNVEQAGSSRLEQWENGWKQNLKEKNITPHYFGKFKVNRRNGNFIMALSESYEKDMLYSILDSVFKKYLKKTMFAYEFGCGTGHNLVRLSRINHGAQLYGLDWVKSSMRILKSLGITGYKFNFFKPNKKIKLKPDAGVFTVAALEQTGTNFKKFVNYLIENKPSVVVNIEPITELLDKEVLLDYLSIKYCEKRNYLKGYLTHLKQLEKEGKIKIHEATRNKVGSLYIEGYSVVAWSPC